MEDVYRTEEIVTHKGSKFNVEFAYDAMGSTPWEDCDGHGEVSEWTTRAKRAGELVLCSDRSRKRYYDFAGAVKIARREGWDTAPYKTGTKGERAARAAQADYEYLRAWCDSEWWYAVLHVSLLDVDGEEIEDYAEYLGGVEDGYYKNVSDYAMELALELAQGVEDRILSDASKE